MLVGSRVDLSKGVVRDQHAAVLVVHSGAAFGLFNHPNHAKGRAVDEHLFVQRLDDREKRRGHIFAEHHQLLAVEVLRVGEEPPFPERGIGVDQRERREGAAEVDRGHLIVAIANLVRLLPVGDPHGDVFHRRAFFLDGFAVLQSEGLAKTLFLGPTADVRSLVETADKCSVGAVAGNVFGDVLVEAGDQRSHQHDHAHAHHHAQHGQQAAQLVRAERVERLAEVFAVCLSHGFLPEMVPARPQRAGLRSGPVARREPPDRCRRTARRPWKATAQ